ncbi:ATP-binding protein, partial [Chloroflexota bacterium]
MSEIRPIGLTKGPGETPHEFTFVSPDRDQSLKVGEFITYHTEVDGAKRDILSRVTERRPLRLYPDAFLADPDINPDDVAAMVGYYQGGHELFELTASVIGYYEQKIGDFINPRLPPRIGRPLYLADDHELAKLLSKIGAGEIGSAHIGSLLSRGAGRVPISVDVAAITSTHLAIIASTGAGKSYLAAVLIEELMKPYNRAAVLIVDPHGEYQTLTEMGNDDEFNKGDYRPQVKIFLPGEVKVRTASLGLNDLYYLLPNLTERMEYLLRRAYRDVRNTSKLDKGVPDRWTIAELQIRLRELGEGNGED